MSVELTEIKKCVDVLLPIGDCVLTFDRSLVDQLPDILCENFGVRSASDASRLPALDRLFQLLLPGRREEWDIAVLPALLERAGVNKAEYVPRAPSPIMEQMEKAFSRWTLSTAKENIQAVLTLQKDLGMGQYNASSEPHATQWQGGAVSLRKYLQGVTTVPPSLLEKVLRRSYWELWIEWWKLRRLLTSDLPSLSIGPRWVTEIDFFRQVVGLKMHIGLDLFSKNENLVKVGDMHQMPFPDKHFQMVFIKNTVDKSYDVRQLVAELLRVTRPGGIIIIDQICNYGDCTPLTRTDIVKSENLLRLFRVRSPVQVLVQADIDLTKIRGAVLGDHSRNNARLAIRIPV
jgi:hypothetical protein